MNHLSSKGYNNQEKRGVGAQRQKKKKKRIHRYPTK
jgi:hypothetical protein